MAAATGSLLILGDPQEGGTLTASLTSVSDIDGATTTAYRWQENVGGTWTDLAGQSAATLRIPSDQSYVGKSVRVVATTTDALGGTTEFVGSAQTIANVNDAPMATSPSSIELPSVPGRFPDIAVTKDGSLLLVWRAADGWGWYSQRVSSDGVVSEGPKLIAPPTSPTLLLEVLPQADGSYLVGGRIDTPSGGRTYAWNAFDYQGNPLQSRQIVEPNGPWSYGNDGLILQNNTVLSVSHYEGGGPAWNVGIDLLTPTGQVISTNIPVTSQNGNSQFASEAKPLADGKNVLIVWSDQSGALDSQGWGIHGRIFSTETRTFVTEPFLINQDTAGDESATEGFGWGESDTYALVALTDGGFAVFWRDGTNGYIQGRFYNGAAQGYSARSGEFIASKLTPGGTQRFVDGDVLPSGGVVIVYESVAPDGSVSIVLRTFNASGQLLNDEITLGVADSIYARPRITAVSDALVAVTWQMGESSPDPADLLVHSELVSIADIPDASSPLVVIQGASVQGQTLTANTSAIVDADGLGTFSYVWKASGAVIAGATSSTLVLGQAQVGKAITVEVSYTDAQGTAEGPLVSAATAAVANVDDEATGTLNVSGTAAEGGTLTASLTSVSDIDGATTTAYRWQENVGGTWTDLSGQTATTLSIPSDQSYVGKSIRVVATTTDALGGTTEFVGSAQTIANVNDVPTGLPTITGTARQGQTLTAITSGIADADGFRAQDARLRLEVSSDLESPLSASTRVESSYSSVQGAYAPFANPRNLALGAAVSASGSIAGYPMIHATSNLTDGKYGNGRSWVNDESSAPWIILDLQQTKVFDTLAFGRDRLGMLGDRGPGQFKIFISNDNSTFTEIYDSESLGFNGLGLGQTIKADFPQVSARFVKLQLSNVDAAIDEIEIWQSSLLETSLTKFSWKADGIVIDGATSSTLLLGQAQVGKTITVEVRYTDGFGTAEGPLASAATAAVANLDDEATGTLNVTGTTANPDLIHQYTFDSGSIAIDSVGGANGTLFGGASIIGGALSLNGIDGYVETIGNHIIPDIGDFTLSLFAKQNAFGSGYVELISQAGPNGSFYIGYDPSRFMRITDAHMSTNIAFPGSDVYHHYALSVSGAVGSFYIDGVLQGTFSTIARGPGAEGTRFGRQYGGWAEFFNGTIDNIEVYDVALSASEVYALSRPSVLPPVSPVNNAIGEGGTLTASLASVSDIDGATTTAYRWQENVGGTWTDLAGQRAASLNIPSDQSYVGKSVRAVATTTDVLGGTTEFTSTAQTIANVNDAPTGLPMITGTPTQGLSLTANTAAIADADGLGAFTYVWKADGTVIAGASASTLVLGQAQVGKAITVEVSYTDGFGTAEGPLASAATAIVAGSGMEPVTGTSTADTLRGTGEPDTISRLEGLGGNDSLIGGSRSDVAVYTGNRSDYTIRTVAGVTTVTDNRAGSPDGVDTLRGLNVLQFSDTMWFQSAAANRTTLGGGAQRYAVENGAFVTGTNAAEHFVVSSSVSASVSSGAGDTVDLAGAISGYTFRASGNQLQVSDGVYTVWLTVAGNPLTLRTASGSTTAAIDFAAGGVIKLGGTQVVGSATFDAAASILNGSNLSEQGRGVRAAAAPRVQKTGTSGADSLSGDSQLLTYFEGGGGNDTLVGGSRSDVAVYSGNRSSYTVRTVAGVTTVTDTRENSPDGVDTLRGINVLQFADGYLFQNAAANRTTLGGSSQRYAVSNGEYVIGTNAVEHFVVADDVSASIATGAGDVVDLARSIDSYSYRASGSQLQISDGIHLIAISVPSTPLTLRTASGSTTVAIDFAAGGVIKLGGTQVVGSSTFDAASAILDSSNVTTAEMLPIRLLDGVPIAARPGVMDVFLLDAGQSIDALVTGFEPGDVIRIANLDEEIGVALENLDFTDGAALIVAGQAALSLFDLPTDLFSDEASFESVYGQQAITYVI